MIPEGGSDGDEQAATVQAGPASQPTAASLFLMAAKIGMMSVGGNASSWVYREIVVKRRWMNEHDLLSDMAVSRVLPGTNITNLTVVVGYRLRGVKGAAAGFIGLITPPFIILMLLLEWYNRLKGPELEALLQGAAAGVIGPVAYLGVRSAIHGGSTWYTGLVLALVALAAILKFPLVIIVAVALPASLALVWAVRRHAS